MARFCILTDTTEFKEALAKFNISKSSLEKVLYNYYNNVVNSDDTFPSDEYILKLLNPKIITNNKKIIKFVKWNNYNAPIKTKNINEFNKQLNKVKSFFTEDLFVTYVDSEGYSVIKVAEFLYDKNSQLEFINQNEIEDIRQRSINDNTFMKAPNGKPTNLTERQWLQVRTKAFKEWFGDWINDPENASKVVDENGEPMVVYHHTNADPFEIFDLNRTGLNWKESRGYGRKGAFFLSYALTERLDWGKNIMPVFLNIRNPEVSNIISTRRIKPIRKDTDGLIPQIIYGDYNVDKRRIEKEYEDKRHRDAEERASRDVFDMGLKYIGKRSLSGEFVVFKRNQIKSADNNIGIFSTKDNIYNESISFENSVNEGKADVRLLQMFAKNNRFTTANNKKVTVKDLLSLIKDSRYSSIAELLETLDKLKELDNVKVNLVGGSTLMFNRKRAYYNASERTIYINVNAQYENGDASSVLLHEILHPLTIDRIQQNPKLRKELLGIIDEYQAVYFNARYYSKLDDIDEEHHAVEEFIADVWSNPETINNLKNIKTKDNKNKTLWDKFKLFFQNLFSGIFLGATDNSLFAKASSSIIELLETQVENKSVGNYYESMQTEGVIAGISNPFTVNVNRTITEADKIYAGSYEFTIQPEQLEAIDKRADSKEILDRYLKGTLSSLPFGAIVRINTGDIRTDARILKMFMNNSLLFMSSDSRKVEIDQSTREGAQLVTYLKQLNAIPKTAGMQSTGNIRSALIYGFTYVKPEWDIRNNRLMKELNDNVSGKRLRSLAISAVYKISELVTQIQEGNPIIEQLFDDELLKQILKLKGEDRITIIKNVTIKGLSEIVKDKYFNLNANNNIKNINLDNLNRKKRKEIKAIYENFDAFINFGYVKLQALEGISIEGNPQIDLKIIELFDGEDEQTILEIMGSSLEHWLVGFRSVSAMTNLSKLIKNTLEHMYNLDNSYTRQYDEYGMEKRVNSTLAVADMLSWFTEVQNVDDMVKTLQNKVDKYPWLVQLVNDDAELRGNDGNLVGIGKLISLDKLGNRHSENEQFKSLFFNNMYLYFQKYGVINADGNISIINDKSSTDAVAKEVITTAKTGSKLFRNDIPYGRANSGENKTITDKLIDIRLKLSNKTNIKNNTVIDDELVKDVKTLFNLLGITLFNEESIKSVLIANPKYILNLSKYTSPSNGIIGLLLRYNRDSKKIDNDFWKNYKKDVDNIIKPFADFIIGKAESVTYQDGKLYYSYVLPSYMSKFNNKVKKGDNFMEQEFKSEFFGLINKEGKKVWLNEWMRKLANDPKAREDFSHKVVLSDNGVNYQRKTPKQYMSSILNEYFYSTSKRLAWYRIPMMSNKPSEEYLRFYRYTSGFKSQITGFLVNTTMLEILRISDVLDRAKRIEAGDLNESEKIKFYDINVNKTKEPHTDLLLLKLGIELGSGTRFVILNFLLSYLDEAVNNKLKTGLGLLLLDLILGKNNNNELSDATSLFGEEKLGEDTLLNRLKVTITNEMNREFQRFVEIVEAEGVIEKNKNNEYVSDVKKLGKTNDEILNNLEEFFWNDFYAATSIMQMYITDPVYYGTAEELQKRLAQLHAPGSRLNVLARDRNGKLFSAEENGKHIYRHIKLLDNEVISDTISNIRSVFESLITENRNNAPLVAYYTSLKNFIIDSLSKVNVTDALTFCTPTAMRKKLGMLGLWTDIQEEAYQRLAKGLISKSDLSVLMLPLKPFMFSQKQLSDPDGLFKTRRVGVLVKTSEYLLILADVISRGANKDTKLSTIFDIIEESLAVEDPNTKDKIPTGKGIDAISFESAIKTGLSGVVNLNNLSNEEVKITLRKAIYAGSDGTNITSQYNAAFVDELDYEDYSIQLQIPTHFFGKQQLGSLTKALIFADIEEYEKDENGRYAVDVDGNKIDRFIYIKNKDGKSIRTTVREAKKRYFELLAKSIDKAKDKLIKDLNLDLVNEGIQNVAISKLLKELILDDARFGSDLLWAVDTNEKGEFNIPLSDPTHSIRILQLLYAIIKNRIYKQEIHGGPVVQVSNWGTEDLHIRYTNKDGETLLTENEFNLYKQLVKSNKEQQDSIKRRAERASILNKLSKHAPVTVIQDGKSVSLNTYEQYKNYHMLDGGVIYECYAPIYNERLLKYEDAKTGIIDVEEIRREEPQLLELIGYRIPTEAKYSMASLRIVGFLPREAGEGIMLPKEWTAISGSDFDVDKLYIMRRSFVEVGNRNEGVRWAKGITEQDLINDEIFDIMQAVLESNQALSKVVKIGTFDKLKEVGYKLAVLREESIEYDNLTDNIKELRKRSTQNKNLAFVLTHLLFFKQNMVAAKLIGVFAQSNISHAYLQMYADSIGSEKGIIIDNLYFNNFKLFDIPIDKNYLYIDAAFGFDGTPISDNIALFLAASVDAVKDPILNLLNINMKTVNAATIMMRMGFNIEQIGLLFGQDIITQITQRMDKTGEDFKTAIDEEIKEYKKLLDANDELRGVRFDLDLNAKELKNNLLNPSLLIDYTVLMILKQIEKIANDTRSIIHMTRFNSISSAKGPNIINSIVEQFKTDIYEERLGVNNPELNRAISNPVLRSTTEAVDELENLLITNRFVLAKPHFADTFKKYINILGVDVNFIDKKDAKRFSDFYMNYMINAISNIFDLSYKHRKEVMTTYPQQILALKSNDKFKDNKFVQSILLRQDEKDEFLSIDIDLIGISSEDIEDIKADFNDFAELEPELTNNIIEYMFNRGGFGFSPKTFTNLITGYIKTKLMNKYLNNLKDLENDKGYYDRTDDITLDKVGDNIIYQYMLHFRSKNFIKKNINSLNKLDIVNSKKPDNLTLGDTFKIDDRSMKYGIYLLTLPSSRSSKEKVLLTVAVDNIDNGISTVTVVEKLGGDGQGIEINPSLKVIKSIYNVKESIDNNQNLEVEKSSDESENLVSSNIDENLEQEQKLVQQQTSNFQKHIENSSDKKNNNLAKIILQDAGRPVAQALQNQDLRDVEYAIEQSVFAFDYSSSQSLDLLEYYTDLLNQQLVYAGSITLQLSELSKQIDKDSTTCK